MGPSRQDWPDCIIVGARPTYLATSVLCLNRLGLKSSAAYCLAITGPTPGCVLSRATSLACLELPKVSFRCSSIVVSWFCRNWSCWTSRSRHNRNCFDNLRAESCLRAFEDHARTAGGCSMPCWRRKLLIWSFIFDCLETNWSLVRVSWRSASCCLVGMAMGLSKLFAANLASVWRRAGRSWSPLRTAWESLRAPLLLQEY